MWEDVGVSASTWHLGSRVLVAEVRDWSLGGRLASSNTCLQDGRTGHRVAKSWTCQATEHTHKTEESRLIYGQDTLGVGQYIPRPGSKSATSYVNLGESLNLP